MLELTMYRQGDVLIISTATPNDQGTKISRENGKIVLAHGEVTGHSHAIAEPEALFALFGNDRILISPVPVVIEHEEHAPISLPAGAFKIIIQREYAPDRIRSVAD